MQSSSKTNSTPPRAILFDAYGTLLDVHSITELADSFFPGHGAAISRALREKQIEYSRLRSMAGQYKLFWDVTADALKFTCAAMGLPLSESQHGALMQQYGKLAAFAEVTGVLGDLRGLSIPLGVLTNGNREMINLSLNSANISSLFDVVLTSDSVQRFKPDPSLYALGPAALNLPANEILFVSSNGWDACAAQWYGYQAFWINRSGLPLEVLDSQPAYQGTSLNDITKIWNQRT